MAKRCLIGVLRYKRGLTSGTVSGNVTKKSYRGCTKHPLLSAEASVQTIGDPPELKALPDVAIANLAFIVRQVATSHEPHLFAAQVREWRKGDRFTIAGARFVEQLPC